MKNPLFSSYFSYFFRRSSTTLSKNKLRLTKKLIFFISKAPTCVVTKYFIISNLIFPMHFHFHFSFHLILSIEYLQCLLFFQIIKCQCIPFVYQCLNPLCFRSWSNTFFILLIIELTGMNCNKIELLSQFQFNRSMFDKLKSGTDYGKDFLHIFLLNCKDNY